MSEKTNDKNNRHDKRQLILTMGVDCVSYTETIQQMLAWVTEAKGRYSCIANVHMCMETYDCPKFRQTVNGADLVVPDGRPLVWALQMLGEKNASQVRGYDLMLKLFQTAELNNIPIGFYGNTHDALEKLKTQIAHDFPKLKLACAISPPFRPLTPTEENTFLNEINRSGARILFVSLGCPKQEQWMADYRDRLSSVMLGIGAALDFYIGTQKNAPQWIQKVGLEWLYRLLKEPRRLWKRYFKHNPRFIWYFLTQWIKIHRDN
jgi:N-acetylglucosaminyldiphosphoundecaprenol N-acetyl-beta-D-mannosaminyltransferase